MHGWFRKLLKARSSSPTHEQETKVTTTSCVSTSDSFSSSHSSSGEAPTGPLQPQSILNSPQRWTRKYDVLVCHSDVHSDMEEALRLVTYLETSPRSLRCYLWHRDTCPGGSVFTELCQAMLDSHVRVLLITPNFVTDEWCKYMMHQALAEGPFSNRNIPLVHNMLHSQYPKELKSIFFADLSRNRARGYNLVGESVLKYLKDLIKNVKTADCNAHHSSGLYEDCSNQEDTLMSKVQLGTSGSDREEK